MNGSEQNNILILELHALYISTGLWLLTSQATQVRAIFITGATSRALVQIQTTCFVYRLVSSRALLLKRSICEMTFLAF